MTHLEMIGATHILESSALNESDIFLLTLVADDCK